MYDCFKFDRCKKTLKLDVNDVLYERLILNRSRKTSFVISRTIFSIATFPILLI